MVAWQGYIVILGGFCKSQALFWINCAAGGNPYFGHKLLQLALLAHLVHAWELSDGIHLHIKSDTEGEKGTFIGWKTSHLLCESCKCTNEIDMYYHHGGKYICTLNLIQRERRKRLLFVEKPLTLFVNQKDLQTEINIYLQEGCLWCCCVEW